MTDASAVRPGRAPFVGALDQGTTSTRFIVLDADGRELARDQLEHRQLLPRPGWVEHDPVELLDNVGSVIGGALARAGIAPRDLAAIGIANQRETFLVWDRRTGRPRSNAIVWQDCRSADLMASLSARSDAELVRFRTGLPIAAYSSAAKLQWLLNDDPRLADEARRGQLLFGTIDSWLVWNLTGGPEGGRHVTDVTNASRTMLMNLETLSWDDDLLELFGIPRSMLAEILPSASKGYGSGRGPVDGVPITGVLGDQHAALLGQGCVRPGDAKNTYGTGNFLLLNTGSTLVRASAATVTTIAYQLADSAPVYALEGSVAATGAAVQWLRDQLGVIAEAAEIEALAAEVTSSEGVYFVPAFSGLLAPYWCAQARGSIVGLSRYHTRAHLARATLEAICFQSRDVADALAADAGFELEALRVDGGITQNELCMQLQADVLGIPVIRPALLETTCLGAALAAGLAAGVWSNVADLLDQGVRTWTPSWPDEQRERAYSGWRAAVRRTIDWADAASAG